MPLKSKIVPIAFLVLSLLLKAPPAPGGFAAEVPENFELVSENEYLQLGLCPLTTEITVVDKRTGVAWYSNPLDRKQREKIARGVALKRLNSQLQIVYYTPEQARRQLDNFTDAVELEQFKITELPNGVRIDYTLGKEWTDKDYIPALIRVEEFDNLLASLETDEQRKLLAKNYQRVCLRPFEEGEKPIELADLDIPTLLGNVRFTARDQTLSDSKERELNAAVIDTVVDNRNDVDRRSTLRAAHLTQLLETMQETDVMLLARKISKWDFDDMVAAVRTSTYSPRRIQEEHEATSLDPPQPNPQVFRIPLVYTLEGDNLVVEIPTEDVQYPYKTETESGDLATFPLHSINVLPFFGAAGVEEDGYIFVPDGSGALIELNNGKTDTPAYSRVIYGNDPGLGRMVDETTRTQIYMPVYGLKKGDDAFVAIVDQGASMTKIQADISGRSSSFNVVSTELIIVQMTRISMPGEEWRLRYVYADQPNTDPFRVVIGFLQGDEANYAGMAHYYQSYLIEQHGLTRSEQKENIPLFLEVLGGAKLKRPVLGLPITRVEPLTTFEQAGMMVEELTELGVANIELVYTGWLKGGLEHNYPYGIKIEKNVGAEKGFRELRDFLTLRDIPFYPNLSLSNAHGDFWYRSRRDTLRQLDRQLGRIFSKEIDEWVYHEKTTKHRYLVAPSRIQALTDNFFKQYKRLDLQTIGLQHIGSQVSSDFGRNFVPREQALAENIQMLKSLNEQGYQILIDGGNAWALPYVHRLINAPTDSSQNLILDRSVPFYQIALSGHVRMAGDPINLSPDSRVCLLQAVETGSLPYFRLIGADPSVLKDSSFNDLVAVSFDDWKETAADFYEQLNEALSDVQNMAILAHDILEENVYRTRYENDKTFIINYNRFPVSIDGITVPERDFILINEGQERGSQE